MRVQKYALSLRKNLRECTTDQEGSSQSNDSVKFREYGKNQCITKHVVSLADSCDTVCTNLSLTDSREQCNQSQSNTCTQNC